MDQQKITLLRKSIRDLADESRRLHSLARQLEKEEKANQRKSYERLTQRLKKLGTAYWAMTRRVEFIERELADRGDT